MLALFDKFDFRKDEKIELLYIASLANGQEKFYETTTAMLNSMNLKKEPLAPKRNYTGAIIDWYYEALGGETFGSVKPKFIFFMGNSGFPGQETSKQNTRSKMIHDLKALKYILELADLPCEVESTKNLLRYISQGHGSMLGMGKFTSLNIFPLAVLSGIFGNTKRATYAELTDQNAAHEALVAGGCISEQHREQLLCSLPHAFQVTMATIENTLYECFRNNKRIDYFFKNQQLFNIMCVGNESDNNWTVVEKRNGHWQPLLFGIAV